MSNKNELEEFLAQQVSEEIQKEIDANILSDLYRVMKKSKLVWREHPNRPLVLHAGLEYEHGPLTQTGLRETDIDPVQEWCEKSKCGVRISFDMFKFKSRAEITAFLLVWG